MHCVEIFKGTRLNHSREEYASCRASNPVRHQASIRNRARKESCGHQAVRRWTGELVEQIVESTMDEAPL